MAMNRDQDGFTLAELLVGILLFSVISIAFYQVLFSGARGSETSQSVAEISQEARLGFNRALRDTRQASALRLASPSGYAIQVDFNGDEIITPVTSGTGRNPDGDYEELTFVVQGQALYIQACSSTEGLDCGREKSVLLDGVSQIGARPYFSYSSNRLEYDCNDDGVATKEELESPACTVTGLTPALVLASLTDIDYALTVTSEDRSSNFLTHVEMRNLR